MERKNAEKIAEQERLNTEKRNYEQGVRDALEAMERKENEKKEALRLAYINYRPSPTVLEEEEIVRVVETNPHWRDNKSVRPTPLYRQCGNKSPERISSP